MGFFVFRAFPTLSFLFLIVYHFANPSPFSAFTMCLIHLLDVFFVFRAFSTLSILFLIVCTTLPILRLFQLLQCASSIFWMFFLFLGRSQPFQSIFLIMCTTAPPLRPFSFYYTDVFYTILIISNLPSLISHLSTFYYLLSTFYYLLSPPQYPYSFKYKSLLRQSFRTFTCSSRNTFLSINFSMSSLDF